MESNTKRKYIIYSLAASALIFVAVAAWMGWIKYNQALLKPVTQDYRPVLVNIKKTTSFERVLDKLVREKVIRDKNAFVRLATKLGAPNKMQTGLYEVSPSMSAQEIVFMFIDGKTTQNWITIPEGFRITQIAERLEQRGVCSSSEFIAEAGNSQAYANEAPFPLPKGSLEGYLFPNTYRLPPGIGAKEAVKQMLKLFHSEVYEPIRTELAENPFSLKEILTMASIIEREAKDADERPAIASVIVNRLKRNMRLEMCSTVQYALGYWKGTLTTADTKVPSPYNTYLNYGLPQGPICNPGLACIKAALNPDKTPYLYFVAQNNGKHTFSTNYADHLKAKRENR